MKICVVILVALCVTLTTSVMLSGEYVNIQWYNGGPTKFGLIVGGVSVYKANDFTVGINASNTYTSATVLALIMDYNYLKYMPANYSRLFSSLEFLMVRNAHVKYLTNWDFAGLSKLRHLDFQGNEIEYLPGDVFKGVSSVLETVSFIENKLTNVGPNFISNIPKLNLLFMRKNICISMDSTPPFIAITAALLRNCQGPIIADVQTGPRPTYEEYQALNATNVALVNTNKNLMADLNLRIVQIKELQKSLETANNNTKTCFESNKKLSTDLAAANDDIMKKNIILQTNLETIKMQNDKNIELNNLLTKTSADLENCRSEAKRLQLDLSNEQKSLEAMKVTNDMNKQTIVDLNKHIETLKTDLMKKNADAEILNMKLLDAQNALAGKEIINKQQQTTIDNQHKKIVDLEKNLSLSQSKLGNIQAGYNSLYNQLYA